MEDYKPCPFCGGEAELIEELSFITIECKSCHCGTPRFKYATQSVVFDRWNARATDRQIAELEEETLSLKSSCHTFELQIKALKAENQGLREQLGGKWISLKERLRNVIFMCLLFWVTRLP